MRLLLILGSGLLAACTTAPLRPLEHSVASTRAFHIQARFAIRQELPNGAQQSLSGRLNWRHDAQGDRLLLADPLSRGLAELNRTADQATLKLADGRELSALRAEPLLQQTLGFTLPIEALGGWLTGSEASERDRQGRATVLAAPPWYIEYVYDDDAPTAPPARLTIRHTGQGDLHGLELRLRIEEWNTP